MKTARRSLALLGLALCACTGQAHSEPSPSHVNTNYKVKVDDAAREAASIVLETTREAILAPNCDAVTKAGAAGLDKLIADGLAAKLPPNVTVYTTPYVPLTPDSLPDVVTDDGYGGRLCTPHSWEQVKSQQ